MLRRKPWLLLCLVILALCAVPLRADPQAFPFANFAPFESTLVFVNPTAAAIAVPAINHALSVAPGEVRRLDGWPAPGGGVATLDVPSGLVVYVEVRYLDGLLMRIPAIGDALTDAVWLDVLASDTWAAYVFITAPATTVVTLTAHDAAGATLTTEDLLLTAGETVIRELPSGTVSAALAPYTGIGNVPHAPVYAWSYITHRPSHNMIPLTRY